MFYFLLVPHLTYNALLIAAAIIPAIFLMVRVYRADRLERESPFQLGRLVIAGILSALIAACAERILSWLLDLFLPQNTVAYNVILYFVIVAVSEEGAKFFMLRRRSWNSTEFNCQFDGVVYAVFVALGFALWENISYVMHFGFSTALVRAVTAIPGHACFGVFMGVFYGLSKRFENVGNHPAATVFQFFSVFIPSLLHGAYDYIATSQTDGGSFWFIGFVAALFVLSFILVGKLSKSDRYIA